MLGMQDFLFYILASAALIAGLGVILAANPIYCAFLLAITMVSLAGIFYSLGAFFIAGVQLIVYAGAVMVLFVMVLMLFDLKNEMKTFSKGIVSGGLKIASAGLLLGLVMGSVWLASSGIQQPISIDASKSMDASRDLGTVLFTNYLFAFEAIGVLLLMIAIGAVTLSRITGGTHAD